MRSGGLAPAPWVLIVAACGRPEGDVTDFWLGGGPHIVNVGPSHGIFERTDCRSEIRRRFV